MSAIANKAGVSKGYKGIAMEGMIATWYAQNTKKSMEQYRLWAKLVDENAAAGSRVLEVAPGPGYLSIELAKLGKRKITGMDISKTFIEIAQANAQAAGVDVEFRQGNASDMPFDNNTFDFIVCTSAFKNFTEPVRALNEMHRVLKAGGKALIVDLRPDISMESIDEYVKTMGLGPIDSLMTKWTFKYMLTKYAHSQTEFKRFISQTGFSRSEIRENGLGFEVWLTK